MNRRSFLSSATALAAILPAVAVADTPKGVRLTGSHPPEPGFEHIGARRYQAFCNGKPIEHCIRVDTGAGIAWAHDVHDRKFLQQHNRLREIEFHGVITLERTR